MSRSMMILSLGICLALGFTIGAIAMYYHLDGVCSYAFHTSNPGGH